MNHEHEVVAWANKLRKILLKQSDATLEEKVALWIYQKEFRWINQTIYANEKLEHNRQELEKLLPKLRIVK